MRGRHMRQVYVCFVQQFRRQRPQLALPLDQLPDHVDDVGALGELLCTGNGREREVTPFKLGQTHLIQSIIVIFFESLISMCVMQASKLDGFDGKLALA